MREVLLSLLLLLQEITDACQEHLHIERLGNVGIGTSLVSLSTSIIGTPCRKQDNWDMRGFDIFLDTATHICTIHSRHHHVAHDEVGVFFLRLQGSVHTILCH